MENLNAAEFVLFLQKFCPDVETETFDIIKNQKISGRRGMKLNLVDWSNMGIPYGEAVDVSGAISDFQNGIIQFDCKATRDANFLESNKENIQSCSDQCETSTIDEGTSKTDFRSLQPFFTEKELKEMSDYEKGSYLAKKEMYERGLSLGLKIALPSFMEQSPRILKMKQNVSKQSPISTYSMLTRSRLNSQSVNSAASCSRVSNSPLRVNSSATSGSLIVEESQSIHNQEDQQLTFQSPLLVNSGASCSPVRVNSSAASDSVNLDESQSIHTQEDEQLTFQSPLLVNSVAACSRVSDSALRVNSSAASCSLNVEESQICHTQEDEQLTFQSPLLVNSVASCSSVSDSALRVNSSAASCSLNVEESQICHTRKKGGQGKSPHVNMPVEFNDHESEQADDNRSKQSAKRRRTRRKNRPDDGLSEEAFVARLPKFNIDEILSEGGPKLKSLKNNLQEHGTVFGKDRKLLMRTLTKFLYFNHVKDVKLVTTEMKSGMASSLITQFPLFRDTTDPTKRSWWRVFDPAGPSGFIANCSTGILRALDPKDRPRGGGLGPSYYSEEDESDDTEKDDAFHDPEAEWMRTTMPWESNRQKLLHGMEASFQCRRRWIVQKGPAVTDILSRYPHLVSFNCEFIEKEFNMLFPGKGHLFAKGFPHLVQSLKRLNELHEVEGLNNGENCEILGACLCLGAQLPRPNLAKKARKKKKGTVESVMPVITTLVTMVPLGTNVQDTVNARRRTSNTPVQPYLLGLVPQKEFTKLFVVADSKIIEVGSASILQGLDMLFKSYNVFNVDYPLGWNPFWELVENGLSQINPAKLTNSALEILKKHKIVK